MTFWEKNKWAIIISVILVLVIIGTFVGVYFIGKKESVVKGAADKKILGGTTLTDAEAQTVKDYANRLKADIYNNYVSGFLGYFRDDDLYKSLLAASDRVLAATYLQYKQDNKGASLPGDLANESYWGDTNDNVNGIISRLNTMLSK